MRQILACVPRDRSELPQGPDLDAIIVTDLYTLRRCENLHCAQDIWVGPRQMALYNANPDGFWVLCYLCGAAAQAQVNGHAFEDSPVHHLGGGYPREGRARTQ